MNEKEVESYFKKVLKIIENEMGINITSEIELKSVGKARLGKTFKGVFPVDRLPPLKQGQCRVINLDRSGMPGSHWVGVYKNKLAYSIYDSFGRRSSKILPSLKKLSINYKDSDYDAEQRVSEDNCGQHSLSWLFCVKQLGIKSAMKI